MNTILTILIAAIAFVALLFETVENWRRLTELEEKVNELEKRLKKYERHV
jgi:uncharacterized protein with PhoU and TrkA domain